MTNKMINRKNRLRITVTALLMATALRTSAQEMPLKDKILSMRQQMENTENLHLVMEVTLKDRSGAEVTKQRGEIWKAKTNYSYVFSGIELLMNARLKVMVNKQEKKISVSKRRLKDEKDMMAMQFPMEKMQDKIQDAACLGQDEGRWHYEASAPDFGVSKMDLFFAEDHLDEMRYWQGEHQTIVKFSVFDIHPAIAKDKFNESKFINKKGNNYYVSPQYKEYRFVDSQ